MCAAPAGCPRRRAGHIRCAAPGPPDAGGSRPPGRRPRPRRGRLPRVRAGWRLRQWGAGAGPGRGPRRWPRPLRHGAVVHPCAALLADREPAVPQDLQMVARSGRALADALGDVAGADLVRVQQHRHDLDPAGSASALNIAAGVCADSSATADSDGWQHADSTVSGARVPRPGSAVVVAMCPAYLRQELISTNFEGNTSRSSKFCFDERRSVVECSRRAEWPPAAESKETA